MVVKGEQKDSSEPLSYVQTPKDDDRPLETFGDKFVRKTKENPLVPIGVYTGRRVGLKIEIHEIHQNLRNPVS